MAIRFQIEDKSLNSELVGKIPKLGDVLYVCFNDDGSPISVSSSPCDGCSKFGVTWANQNETEAFVMLENTIKCIGDIKSKIKLIFSNQLDDCVLTNIVEKLKHDADVGKLYLTSTHEDSRLNSISTVCDRLQLIDELNRSEEIPWPRRSSLIVYLLLTCFDRLGQPAEWLPFQDWLSSKKSKSYREHASDTINTTDLAQRITDQTKWLYDVYAEHYGVKSSFIRFITDILPETQRDKLLSSLAIFKCNYDHSTPSVQITEKTELYGYLYKIRNDYTHKCKISVRNFVGNIKHTFEELVPSAWEQQEQPKQKDAWYSILTLDWPNILIETVRCGLLKYLLSIADV